MVYPALIPILVSTYFLLGVFTVLFLWEPEADQSFEWSVRLGGAGLWLLIVLGVAILWPYFAARWITRRLHPPG